MRKTCKNHPKNEQKTHQKSSKNKFKKTHRKINDPLSTKRAPKGDQKTTDKGGKGRDPGWNPPRKKNTAKTRPTAGKGCMREGYTQTVTESQHAPAVGRTRPGGEFVEGFLKVFGPFWLRFWFIFWKIFVWFLHNFLGTYF